MKSDEEEGEERGGKGEGQRPYAFEEEEGDEPRDFGAGPGPGADAEAAGAAIRARYVQGLQVMLQRQCEALVEQFGVGPLICGLAGTIWLRYVAASQVLDDGWARKVITESKAAAAATPSQDDEQGENFAHINDILILIYRAKKKKRRGVNCTASPYKLTIKLEIQHPKISLVFGIFWDYL